MEAVLNCLLISRQNEAPRHCGAFFALHRPTSAQMVEGILGASPGQPIETWELRVVADVRPGEVVQIQF